MKEKLMKCKERMKEGNERNTYKISKC